MYLVNFLLLSFLRTIVAQSCGGTVDLTQTPFASISSPGYPNYYTGNQLCLWTITNSVQYSVKAVCYIDIPSGNCNQDEVIFDPTGQFGRTVATPYCGINSYVTINSVKNQMNIGLAGTNRGRFSCNLYRNGLNGTTNCDCGIMNPPRQARIVNGIATYANQFPALVKIYILSVRGTCGGTIISDRIAMTAAHCVQGFGPPSNFRVLAGAYNVNDLTVGRTYAVIGTKVHENFDSEELVNDIALLFVSPQFMYGPNVSPICLAATQSLSQPGANLVAVGWGRTSASGSTSPIPRSVLVPIVNPQACAQYYGDDISLFTTGAKICTSTSDNKGTCLGDSGGPFLVFSQTNQRLLQISLVSYGPVNCVGAGPAVSTGIYYFLPWIFNNSPAGASFCGF